MSLLPARSPLDLGGLRLLLKSGLNITVVHGIPFTTTDFPAGIDSEVVFTEVPPTRGTQVQQTSVGRNVRVRHRVLSGGAAGDASVTIFLTVIDRAGNTMSGTVGFTVTPSTQPGYAFDMEALFDLNGFGGVLEDATFYWALSRTGSGDTLLDPLHLLHSWMEVENP